ncbi:LysR substrate-binding domain-containing protein [Stenotrophomonas bentonitica]|uniref:LysR substrate-binding domain-containing protein n=1 Tax=Stenotrophomonas bentonitica TaxID=1450134 RepID=A0ABU9JJL8_9GAMM|nr:LysR substrate-binding domain-containing protein [uncultured Luteimonas sp.]
MNARVLPSLSALRAFEAAARHRSAKRAAQELSVTPTAISHQVRQLEEALGTALFVRTPRQLVLTAPGRELQQALTASFDAMAEAVARLRAPSARQAVTISATPAVVARWLLPRVEALHQRHPQLDLRFHVSHRPEALDGVTADVAVRYGSGQWPGLVAEKLFDTVFVPACSPALGLRRRADLPRHPLLHFAPLGVFDLDVDWAVWQRRARVPGLDVSAGPVFSDETHTVTAALAGQGVALMGRALITAELASGTLVQPFGPELPGQPFHLVYPVQRAGDPLVRAVRDWLLHEPEPERRTMPHA